VAFGDRHSSGPIDTDDWRAVGRPVPSRLRRRETLAGLARTVSKLDEKAVITIRVLLQ
jgi:hypothetical protein